MDAARRWYTKQVGRRGTALIVFGLLDLAYASSLFFPAPDQIRSPTAMFLASIAPLWIYGVVWLISAITAFASSVMRSDRWGFAAVATVKAMWSGLMVWAAFDGVPRAWVSVAIWLGYAGFVALISAWPEPADRR